MDPAIQNYKLRIAAHNFREALMHALAHSQETSVAEVFASLFSGEDDYSEELREIAERQINTHRTVTNPDESTAV